MGGGASGWHSLVGTLMVRSINVYVHLWWVRIVRAANNTMCRCTYRAWPIKANYLNLSQLYQYNLIYIVTQCLWSVINKHIPGGKVEYFTAVWLHQHGSIHFHTTYTANSGLSCLWYSSRVRWFHIWNTTGTVQLERQCDFTRVSLACHLRVARVSHRERDAIRTRVGSTRKGPHMRVLAIVTREGPQLYSVLELAVTCPAGVQ